MILDWSIGGVFLAGMAVGVGTSVALGLLAQVMREIGGW